MIIKPSLLATGLVAGALLMPPPAASATSPSPDQLKAALLTPEDLGSDFTRTTLSPLSPLDSSDAHTKSCTRAVKSIAPLHRTKIAARFERADGWEWISEYLVSGTRGKISRLERSAKALTRDCPGVRFVTKDTKDTIRKLSVGRLGDAMYAIRYRSGFPDSDLDKDSMVATDIVIIRVRNTMITLAHTGNVNAFDPAATKTAAEAATRRLQSTLEQTTG
ncbi:hypothetical protein [Nonomuraea sediminis]|uniref:hypothetical protein n=1 Tax=Nonomuraea sediminis TaxID=2835864 RepID=UPI001BDD8CF5|nr:hypothetical protein [Nonomuraea sediminis]